MEEIIQEQRQYFRNGKTLGYADRIHTLKKLLEVVRQYEHEILDALQKDLNKNTFNGWSVEFGVIIQELLLAISNLKEWMKPERIQTPLLHFRAKSSVIQVPHGHVVIIAPWNYPFLLSLRPAIGAIAAGNAVMIKPPEAAAHTTALLATMINKNFPTGCLHVYETDGPGTAKLLENKFDFIFFTGGTEIGRKIYTAAARHLTPVVLELGGKNPCIVEADADITVSADRIAWGRFANAGQTCVAPDYLLVHRSVLKPLVDNMQQHLIKSYGPKPELSPDYGRIINEVHYDRIMRLMDGCDPIIGGYGIREEKFIAPTLLLLENANHPIMQEEVFGPILPIIPYDELEEAIAIVQQHPDPLVFYLFSKNKALARRLAVEIPSGDMAINDCVLHFGQIYMPIGGKGSSGVGKYQGPHTFKVFSHQKSIYRKYFFPDIPVRYSPSANSRLQQIKAIFKIGYR